MYPVFETIRVSAGRLEQLEAHANRITRTQKALFPNFTPIPLTELNPPEALSSGVHRCRLEYGADEFQVEYFEYIPRTVQSLKIVSLTEYRYDYKWTNREQIQGYMDQKQDADDILMTRDGYILDTSYSNLAFFDGHEWFTPSTCLLPGTRRQGLIESGKLIPRTIQVRDLPKYLEASLINAMLDLGVSCLPISQIR